MGLNNPTAGYSYAAEFQSSALPWVTSSIAASGSATRFDFQTSARFITLSNLALAGAGNPVLAFGFTAAGMNDVNSNKFFLSGSQQITLETRVKTLFVMGQNAACNFSLFAGLTTVLANNTPVVTGSQTDVSTGTTVFWPGVG